VRVIGRRKARNAPPAEEESPPPSSEPEPPEWRVIGPTEDVAEGAAAADDRGPGGPDGPFDLAAAEAAEADGTRVAPELSLVRPPGAGPSGHVDAALPSSSGDAKGATGGREIQEMESQEAEPSEEPDVVPAGGGIMDDAERAEAPPLRAEPAAHGEADRSVNITVTDDPVTVPVEDAMVHVPSPSDREAKHPKHASAEEDPVSSVLRGPGPQGQRTLPRVVAIANQKGGVGKTTTTVNLGAALAELGYRVLVIDLDPQGNATTGLGIDARNFEYSMYDVIMHETPLEDCIEPTSVRNLFVAPATIDLAGVEIELVPAFSRELRLRKAIERVVDDFDFVMIDCPPSLGLITINGLAAASEVLVPIQCEYYALEGLSQLLRNVHLVASNLNEDLEVSAIVLTMFDGRTRLAIDVAAEVREHFKEKVCRNVIPRTIRLSEAPSFGQPITVFDPTSRGAIAYRELAKEVSNGAPKRAG
jgi:chromosome partitioning protein